MTQLGEFTSNWRSSVLSVSSVVDTVGRLHNLKLASVSVCEGVVQQQAVTMQQRNATSDFAGKRASTAALQKIIGLPKLALPKYLESR